MIENICLYRFVSCPDLIIAKYIDFQWQPVIGGGQLPDQKGHMLMNFWIVTEIGLHISPKGTNVGQLSSVYKAGRINAMFLVVL